MTKLELFKGEGFFEFPKSKRLGTYNGQRILVRYDFNCKENVEAKPYPNMEQTDWIPLNGYPLECFKKAVFGRTKFFSRRMIPEVICHDWY